MPKQVCELQGQVAWEYITVHFVYLNISGTNIKNYKHVRVVVTGTGLGEQLRVANNLFAKRLTFKQIMVTGFSFIDLIVLKILIDGGLYKILELQRIIRFIKKHIYIHTYLLNSYILNNTDVLLVTAVVMKIKS